MFSKIEDAIKDIREGKLIIVVDDPNRENEGDFVAAAEMVTPEMVNFMATHGRGLICVSLNEERCEELGLELMVSDNTATHNTPFTVSVDLLGQGCTTGISAFDRAKTIHALVNEKTKPTDLGRPGHIFPLKAKKNGILRRAGHTEASMDLAKLAGLKPAGILVEIMNEDGSMARMENLTEIAEKFSLKIITIEDLIKYRLSQESLIALEAKKEVSSSILGKCTMFLYKRLSDDLRHIALVKGTWNPDEVIPVRVHRLDSLKDSFGINQNSKSYTIQKAISLINEEEKGIILCINGENQTPNSLFMEHFFTERKETKYMDTKDFGIGAQILHHLGARKIKILTNSNIYRKGLSGFGVEVVESVMLKDEVL